jgi:hypothetical protein
MHDKILTAILTVAVRITKLTQFRKYYVGNFVTNFSRGW